MRNTISGLILTLILGTAINGQTPQTRLAFNNAMVAVKSGNYIDGLTGFRKALMHAEFSETSDDFLSKVHFNIGVCLYQLDRAGESIPEYHKAIHLSGNKYERAYYSLGMAELAGGNWTNAEDAFVNALRLNEKNGEAWFDLAFVYIAKKDYDSAAAAFDNSIRFSTVDAAISHNNLGVLAALKGELNAAEKEFVLAMDSAKGNFPTALSNLEICKAMRLDSGRSTAKLILTNR